MTKEKQIELEMGAHWTLGYLAAAIRMAISDLERGRPHALKTLQDARARYDAYSANVDAALKDINATI